MFKVTITYNDEITATTECDCYMDVWEAVHTTYEAFDTEWFRMLSGGEYEDH